MKTKARVCSLVLFFWVFYSSITHSQQQTTISITAEELVRIAVENLEKSNLLKQKLVSFERTKIEHELNRGGNRKSIVETTTTYHGEEYPENQRTEDETIVDFNKLLAQSYDYFFLDPTDTADKKILNLYSYQCTNCYILRFQPKKNLPDVEIIAPPGSGALEKTINETAMRINGIIYIDKDHFFIRKYTGKLDNGFNLYNVTRINRASIDLEQELRPDLNNIIIISNVKYMFQVRILLLSHLTREHEYKYANYRLNK